MTTESHKKLALTAIDELDALETELETLPADDEKVLFADALRYGIVLDAIETALATQ